MACHSFANASPGKLGRARVRRLTSVFSVEASMVAPSATAMIVGLQLTFSSFFLGVLGLRRG